MFAVASNAIPRLGPQRALPGRRCRYGLVPKLPIRRSGIEMPTRLVVEKTTTLSPKRAPTVIRQPKHPRFSEYRVRRSLMRILRANELCSIATVTGGGRAHNSHLYFCWSEDLEFYFLSDPRSLHCRNLLTNPSMDMTVFSSDQPWDRPGRGLQLWGRCVEAKGQHAGKAERAYRIRFPKYSEYRASVARDARGKFQYRFWRFVPWRTKLLDEREFGGGVFVTASIWRIRERPRVA